MTVRRSSHPQQRSTHNSRRRFLQMFATTGGGLLAPSVFASIAPKQQRSLSFVNLHTGESLATPYWVEGEYLDEALVDINKVLRDHRTGDVHPMDQRLLDLLYALQLKVDTRKPFHVISGYRSPKTNAMLRKGSGGVAKRSMHMQGKAIDIRLPGYDTARLRQAAMSLKLGGVGYYRKSDFLHVDVGRVRSW